MAKSIDKLDAAISAQLSSKGAIASLTKDQFLDFIDLVSGSVKTNLKFYTDTAHLEKQMKEFIKPKAGETRKSVIFYQAIYKEMQFASKKAMDERFMGAIVDTLAAYAVVLDEVSKNIDNIFQNKSINLFNTKVSHAVVFGMIADAEIFCKFVDWFNTLMMSEMIPALPGILPYQLKYIEAAVKVVPALINRVVNGRFNSTFVAGIMNYKNGGSDY